MQNKLSDSLRVFVHSHLALLAFTYFRQCSWFQISQLRKNMKIWFVGNKKFFMSAQARHRLALTYIHISTPRTHMHVHVRAHPLTPTHIHGWYDSLWRCTRHSFSPVFLTPHRHPNPRRANPAGVKGGPATMLSVYRSLPSLVRWIDKANGTNVATWVCEFIKVPYRYEFIACLVLKL